MFYFVNWLTKLNFIKLHLGGQNFEAGDGQDEEVSEFLVAMNPNDGGGSRRGHRPDTVWSTNLKQKNDLSRDPLRVLISKRSSNGERQ